MHIATKTFAVALVLVLTATGLWAAASEEAPAAAAEKEMVTDPTTGEMVTAPQYGGTITYSMPGYAENSIDAAYCCGAAYFIGGVNETLAIADWGIDRDKFDFAPVYLPTSVLTGQLAESWDVSDPLTYIFRIRQGVHWHDKEPMNGRELTADDIVFNYHRFLGLGSGFTEPSPRYTGGLGAALPLESVTAPDQRTVVFKLKHPILDGPLKIANNAHMMPPEVIKRDGNINRTDWQNLVGTGPYEITDWVEESSITYTRNPDYWGTDEKYPENRLPYTDELTNLIIREPATVAAALRSGKLDMLITAGSFANVEMAESLQETNPEIRLYPWDYRSNYSYRAYNPFVPSPTDDIRVRHAIQMALDLETINDTYFKGHGKWEPQGRIGDNILGGYNNPFEEWPEEIKQYWRYDPEGAERLLDEAGYPRGEDGTRFELPMVFVGSYHDVGYYDIVIAYLAEVGIAAEKDPMDHPTWMVHAREATWPGLAMGFLGLDYPPASMCYTDATHYMKVPDDPAQTALHEAIVAATTYEEEARLAKECDMLMIEKHEIIWGPKIPQFTAAQPWVIGYNGEGELCNQCNSAPIYARLWIDQEVKAMSQ